MTTNSSNRDQTFSSTNFHPEDQSQDFSSNSSLTRTRFSVRSRKTTTGKVRTEAIVNKGQDAIMRAAISMNPKTRRTSLFIDHPSSNLQLTGKEARALFVMLQKHYSNVKDESFTE
jgi:hypothetical protein